MKNGDQPLTKKDLEESFKEFQEVIVGGMNQMLTNLINHIDKRFVGVDERFDHLEEKLDNYSKDHEARISALEKQQA